MKKLLVLISLTFVLSMFLSSCSDDDKTTGPSTELKLGELTAKIGSTDWKITDAAYYNDDFVIEGTETLENPNTGNSMMIQFIGIADGKAPEVKTHTTTCSYTESRIVDESMVYNVWSSESATTVVTSVTSTNIIGTFSFTGTNTDDNTTKVISGSFNVPRK